MSLEGRSSRRLAQLAAPLHPVHAPWYVRHPVAAGLEHQFPADGWYWIPEGLVLGVYLGASYELAAHELRNLIERELARAD